MKAKMKAAVLTSPGGPEALQILDVQTPVASTGEVLVRLKAAALNPADSHFRSSGPMVQSDGPFILGHDGAGIVEAIGNGVTQVQVGTRVCFCNGGVGGVFGTYAEFAVVPETQLAVIPDSVDYATAAALPLVFITVWESLHDQARLDRGEFVLIHAGAGGTGHVAVQMAALWGARVAATVSDGAKADLVTRLGAERAIFYKSEDFVEECLDWTSGRGVDVALDNIGAEIFQKTISAMASYGRLVTLLGTPGDDENKTAYVKNLSIHNVLMLSPMLFEMQDRLDRQAEIVAEGLRLLDRGELKVLLDSTFSLGEIAAAHARLDASRSTGKIVISIA